MRTVWLLATGESELFDLAGPWEVLGHANDALGREAYRCRIVTVRGGDLRTRHGLVVGKSVPLPKATVRLPDIALVAGGSPAEPLPADERVLAAWLAHHRARLGTVVGVCTGAFVLAEAGLLDGRRATTHWRFAGELARRHPKVRVVDEAIFERAGKVWTSAGITAGIDLMLAMVEEHHGHDVAIAVARQLVLFLRRSGQQAQFSGALRRQAESPPGLAQLTPYVLEHLDEPLDVARLARAMATSPRTLTRWCREKLGESPAAVVRRLRTEEAQRLLETSALPMKAIARSAGFGDEATLWRAFTRYVGITPQAYRERFAAR